MTFVWSIIVNIALYVPLLSYLTLNNIVPLKSGLEVIQGHSKWYYSKAWAVSYSCSIVTMALSCISSEIKPDIGRNHDFFIRPLACGAPVMGVPVGILPSRLVLKN